MHSRNVREGWYTGRYKGKHARMRTNLGRWYPTGLLTQVAIRQHALKRKPTSSN